MSIRQTHLESTCGCDCGLDRRSFLGTMGAAAGAVSFTSFQAADAAEGGSSSGDKKGAKAIKKQARLNQEAEGKKIAVELIEQLREMEGVRGVHLPAIEWERAVPKIIEAAGLLPRPEMPADERQAKLDEWMADAKQHWTVEGHELVNDGHGAFLVTNRDYTDFELMLEYKTVPTADSGIYLKGTPQVQIWDPDNEQQQANGTGRGSGGLWNNNAPAGRLPLVRADRPVGWHGRRPATTGQVAR